MIKLENRVETGPEYPGKLGCRSNSRWTEAYTVAAAAAAALCRCGARKARRTPGRQALRLCQTPVLVKHRYWSNADASQTPILVKRRCGSNTNTCQALVLSKHRLAPIVVKYQNGLTSIARSL